MKSKLNKQSVIVTRHAYERAKERLSFSTSATSKMAEKAYFNGTTRSQTKGLLSKYVSKIWFEEEKANNIRIYGENIYLFADNILITIYQIPTSNLKKLAKVCHP